MYSEYELEILAEITAQEYNPVLEEYRLVRFVSKRGKGYRIKYREITLVVRVPSGRAVSWHKFPFDEAATELDFPIWHDDPVQYFKDSLLDGANEPDD